MPKFSIHLESYPAKPENLPQELYNAAYSEEAPSEKGVTMMGVQAHVVPYRDTHTLVRSAKPTGNSAVSPDAFCMQLMHAFSKMMHGQGGSQDSLPGFEVFSGKRKNKALADAVAPTGASAGPKLALEDQKAENNSQEEKPANEQDQKGEMFSLSLPEEKKPADPKDQLDAMVGTFQARGKARKIEAEKEKNNHANEDPPKAKAKAQPKAKGKAACKKVAKTAVKQSPPKTPKGTSCKKGSPQSSEKQPSAEKQKAPAAGQTFHWRGGKVHRSDRSSCWRVFLRAGDRNDKKVAFKEDCQAAFVRALRMIEESQ